MAKFTVEIADADLELLAEACAESYGYQAQVTDPEMGKESDNPETKLDFLAARVGIFFNQVVEGYQKRQRERAAAEAAEAVHLKLTITKNW